MKIKIDTIVQRKADYDGTSKSNGKAYCVRAWIVKGTIDGKPCEEIELKTLSAKAAETVKDGMEFDCDDSTYSGHTSYTIKKEPWAGAGGGGGFQKAVSYTVEEFVKLMDTGLKYAEKRSADRDPPWLPEVQQSLAATFIIGAQKAGVKF